MGRIKGAIQEQEPSSWASTVDLFSPADACLKPRTILDHVTVLRKTSHLSTIPFFFP